MQKQCVKCKAYKTTLNFNRDASKKDGLYPSCKECRKPILRKWTSSYKEKHNLYGGLWEKKNRNKKNAHLKVRRAVQKGILTKEPCAKCNKKNAQAHHPDYSKPLIVTWLCSTHHAEAHYPRNI